MHAPVTAILSRCASVLAACSAVVLLWTVANPLIATSMLSLAAVLLVAALIGFAAWAGVETGALLARRWQTATGDRDGMLLAVAALLIISVLLGAAFGVSLSLRAQPPVFFVLLVVAMTSVSLLSGLAVTLRTRPFVVSSIIAVACCMLGGIASGLGFGFQRAASYRPCPLHSYCLDPGPWYGMQAGLPVGTIVGLAVGLIVWLAFGLDLAISSQARHPPATTSA